MRRKQISWYGAFALGAGLSIGLAFGDIPNLVSYQGKLVNANGTPVTNATRLRFRLYQGGDASTFPSTGVLVYNETAVVTPEADGVFTRMIGAGTPGGGCSEGTCALTPDDFTAAAGGPVWIEVMVDPDGVVGTADDDVLLPRTQVGTVGFAFHAASVDGAVGGQITGDLTVSGSIVTQNTVVSSEGLATAGTVTAGGDITAGGTLQAGGLVSQGDVTLAARHGLLWPTSYSRCTSFPGLTGGCTSYSGPVSANLGFFLQTPVFPNPGASQDGGDGQTDNVLMWGYNINPADGGRLNMAESKFVQQIEASYWDGTQQLIEYNWDYQNAAGAQWRPLYFRIRTAPAGGTAPVVDGGSLQLRMCADCQNLGLNSSGNVNIGAYDPANDWSRLVVRNEVRSMPSATSDRFGSSTSMVWRPIGGYSADLLAGSNARAAWESGALQPMSAGYVIGSQTLAEISGASVATRSVSQFAAGLDSRCSILESGTAGGFANCYGIRTEASAPGTGRFTVPMLAGILVSSPAPKGAAITVSNGAGIRINDQKGYGDLVQGSLLIDAQTGGGGTGSKGNLFMSGGGFDDGHLALGAGHLWYDAGAGLFRAKAGAPTSAGDGKAVVTGTGSASHGPLLWGNGADPEFDTGAEVCAASGLTCVTVKSPSGADSDCQKAQGPAIFYALCR